MNRRLDASVATDGRYSPPLKGHFVFASARLGFRRTADLIHSVFAGALLTITRRGWRLGLEIAPLVAALLVWGGVSAPVQAAAAHPVSVLASAHAAAPEKSGDAVCERHLMMAAVASASRDSADAYEDEEDGLNAKRARSFGSANGCLTVQPSVLETHRSLSLASDVDSLRAPPR
jgi:hypothetical protein